MIRLWLSRNASISLHEQLSAQLLLGILSGKLAPDEKLPSVRELARRLKVHGNTIHAVYRDLAKRGWLRGQPGSGVYVAVSSLPATESGIDSFVAAWMREAQALGYSIAELHTALDRHSHHASRFVVVDSDPDLAAILAAELSAAAGHPFESAGCDDTLGNDASLFVNAGHAVDVAEAIGGAPFHFIHLKSMQDVLHGMTRPATDPLIAVVSSSRSVLQWGETLLSALGFDAGKVLLRDTHLPDWQAGLRSCDIVAADVLSAARLPAGIVPVTFHIVSDETLQVVRALVTA